MADFFDRIVILKRTPIFAEVATDDLRVVVEEMQEEAYFAGERVFEINDPSDRMYVVLTGRIGISIDPDVRAAVDAYIVAYNASHDHRATLTSTVEAALKKYLASEGYWPLAKDQ